MKKRVVSAGKLQQDVFRSQTALIVGLALFLALSGFVLRIRSEAQKRDQNLLNVAETVACSPMIVDMDGDADALVETFDTLQDALANINVVSIVGADGVRRYHTNHALIGERYDGPQPDFSDGRRCYAVDSSGPSGDQRRAFAAIRSNDGTDRGFVIVLTLRKDIRREFLHALLAFALVVTVALCVEIPVSHRLSARIKERLMGFEPDSFIEMYRIRDRLLDSLNEGALAVDAQGTVQYINRSAAKLLGTDDPETLSLFGRRLLARTLETGEHETNVPESGAPGVSILVDRFPIHEDSAVVGAVAILHDRTEYVRLAEDLSGARFLVDSMRANNHDFTNKLHVISGLIQMKEYDRAAAYIENISFVQREGISRVVNAIGDPALAALIIGKTARAAELNVRLVLTEGSGWRQSDIELPSSALITIVGNLIDNALEAMNGCETGDDDRELLFGACSRPGALLLTVDDSGPGIPEALLPHIFEKGWTTKGAGHGNGLYQVKSLVESLGGEITVESTEGIGTSFSVSFQRKDVVNV